MYFLSGFFCAVQWWGQVWVQAEHIQRQGSSPWSPPEHSLQRRKHKNRYNVATLVQASTSQGNRMREASYHLMLIVIPLSPGRGQWIVLTQVTLKHTYHTLQARPSRLSRRRSWPGRAAWGRMSQRCWWWSQMAGHRMRWRRQRLSSSSQVSTSMVSMAYSALSSKYARVIIKDPNCRFHSIIYFIIIMLICI